MVGLILMLLRAVDGVVKDPANKEAREDLAFYATELRLALPRIEEQEKDWTWKNRGRGAALGSQKKL